MTKLLSFQGEDPSAADLWVISRHLYRIYFNAISSVTWSLNCIIWIFTCEVMEFSATLMIFDKNLKVCSTVFNKKKTVFTCHTKLNIYVYFLHLYLRALIVPKKINPN